MAEVSHVKVVRQRERPGVLSSSWMFKNGHLLVDLVQFLYLFVLLQVLERQVVARQREHLPLLQVEMLLQRISVLGQDQSRFVVLLVER